jgi:hypothetical protein
MKRTRFIRIVLVVVLVLGCLSLAIYRSIQPQYQGRNLTEWLDSALSRPKNAYGNRIYTFSRSLAENDPASWQSARLGVREIGPDAIPFLLRWTRAKDSPIKAKLYDWLNKHTSFHRKIIPADYYQHLAITGFAMLGEKAKSAWPVLIKATRDQDWETRYVSMRCLVASRPDKTTLLPVLLHLTHDPDSRIQSSAAFWIHYHFPADAETNGVITLFPELKDRPTEQFGAIQTQGTK